MENVIQSHNQLRVTVKAVGLDERILKLFGEVLNKGDQGEVMFKYDGDLTILTQTLSQYPLEKLLIEPYNDEE